MLYRRLGRTDLRVSELSLGTARGASAHPQQFIDVVHASFRAGINFIDTAAGYDGGDSERVLGEALRGHDDVLVETKYCPYESYQPEARYIGTPQALVDSVDESLRRLRRDHLDVLLGHGIRTLETLDRFLHDGSFDAMVRLREQGKVRFIGISELSEADGAHAVLQQAIPTGQLDVVMLTINIFLQTAIDSVLPLCKQFDVGTVVMMPLNQASHTSGLVSREAALECLRRHVAEGTLPAEPPYTDPAVLKILDPYAVPEIALRFVLAQAISTCCVGMSSPERLHDNLRAVDPPYVYPERLQKIKDLFGRIQQQVR